MLILITNLAINNYLCRADQHVIYIKYITQFWKRFVNCKTRVTNAYAAERFFN